MAKKKPGKAETSIRVIKETLTKSALINLIAEENDIPRKTAIDQSPTFSGLTPDEGLARLALGM